MRGDKLINKDDNLAYYIQIYNVLKKRIEDRVYLPHSLLPSENVLAEEFNVTRITVRNAVKMLKEEGKIYTEKGKGSVVKAPSIEQSLFKFYSFGRNYTKRDFQSESVVINTKISVCDELVRDKLGLSETENIIQIIRLRKIDQSPVILEFSHIPLLYAPNIFELDLATLSIYDLLEEKFDLKIIKAKEYLTPDLTDENESRFLEIPYKTPVFITERITYTSNEVPIEYRKSVIRSDIFKFFVELY